MKPDQENITRAKAILRAMAELAKWRQHCTVSALEAAKSIKLDITEAEANDIEDYMLGEDWLDKDEATQDGYALTHNGLKVAQQVEQREKAKGMRTIFIKSPRS